MTTHKWYTSPPGSTSFIPVDLQNCGGGIASGDSSFKDPKDPPTITMPSPYGAGYPNHRLVGYPCPKKKPSAVKKTAGHIVKKPSQAPVRPPEHQ